MIFRFGHEETHSIYTLGCMITEGSKSTLMLLQHLRLRCLAVIKFNSKFPFRIMKRVRN